MRVTINLIHQALKPSLLETRAHCRFLAWASDKIEHTPSAQVFVYQQR